MQAYIDDNNEIITIGTVKEGDTYPDYCCSDFPWEVMAIIGALDPDYNSIWGICQNPDCPTQRQPYYQGVSHVLQIDFAESLADRIPHQQILKTMNRSNIEIINLTSHDINILDVSWELVETIKRSMKVARLDSDKILADNYNLPFPMFYTKYGIPYLAIIDEQGKELRRVQFPPYRDGIIYIVSGIFRANYDRTDFWQPGELVRDNEGQPIGCIGLSR